MPPFSSVSANFAKALVLLAVLNPATVQAGRDPFVVPTPIKLTLGDGLKVVVETGTFEDVFAPWIKPAPVIGCQLTADICKAITVYPSSFPWSPDENGARSVASEVAQYQQLLPMTASQVMYGPFVPFQVISPTMGNRIAQQAPGEPSPTPVGTPEAMVRYVRANAVSSYTGVVPVTSSVPWLRLAEVRDISVPGPLPLFGAATAFGLSRQLRRRISMGG